MKIIISHDVDHITAFEHKNLIIPKHLLRSIIEITSGYISPYEFWNRIKDILNNKWHNLESLMEFNKKNKIPSTFFFGVKNGVGLDYLLEDALFWIQKVMHEGFDVGVHGIAYDNYTGIKGEYDIFKKITGLNKFGIRMHYLRRSNETLDFLNKSGYIFDATLNRLEHPFKVGELWEFPLHVMDGHVFFKKGKWQDQTLVQAKNETERLLNKSAESGLKYFSLLFHDCFFCDSFQAIKNWYIWLIDYCLCNEINFISYRKAIQELENK